MIAEAGLEVLYSGLKLLEGTVARDAVDGGMTVPRELNPEWKENSSIGTGTREAGAARVLLGRTMLGYAARPGSVYTGAASKTQWPVT